MQTKVIRIKSVICVNKTSLLIEREISPLLHAAWDDGYLAVSQGCIAALIDTKSGSILTDALVRASEKGLCVGFVVTPTDTGRGVGYIWALPFALHSGMIKPESGINEESILWR